MAAPLSTGRCRGELPGPDHRQVERIPMSAHSQPKHLFELDVLPIAVKIMSQNHGGFGVPSL